MCRAPPSTIWLPTYQRRARHIRQCCNLAITECHIDVLSLTGPCSSQQRRKDRIGCIESSCKIGDRNADFHWWSVPRAGNMHKTHLCLNHNIVACSALVGASLAVAGDTRIYQAAVDLTNRLVVHVVFLESIGKIILHQDIAVLDELVQDPDSGRLLEGETNRFLVPVYLETLHEELIALAGAVAH